jgi:hypothetical protein
MRRLFHFGLCGLVSAILGIASDAKAGFIDFDDIALAPNTGTIVASNHYAAQGVTIQTILDSGDALVVGSVFTPTVFQNSFVVFNLASSISAPNLAIFNRVVGGVLTFASDEVLFSFATPAPFVSLNSDDAPNENQDVIRLLGLRNVGGGQFEVIAVDDAFDNETTPAGTLLSIDCPGGCDAAVFVQTTEQEGFDNLRFVPEPTTLAILGLGLAGLGITRRRRAA